ncbi:family 1 glycosylhydrolase [Ramlibacter algicola]|uniref:dTDP-4-dehydrorhamnose reductase n=1 Tax=Ramlibacter algicola TaxID=2795217 RepID=A0A934PYE6_9BURK|nr:family 1 glycosylhydrolase [Ramlibacter algicola]MBK0390987.1 SDR family oxidoreductase [Ramlibacter algicola]
MQDPSFPRSRDLRLWAGAECTVNRVGDAWLDQARYNGFEDRIEDLDRLAALGIERLRLPLIWERVAPDGPATANWSWPDRAVKRLRELGVRPIAGLVHHGSGPPQTSLTDARFPELLAEYAAAVAQRFPDIDAYTPINEPLTTARFSGLYGVWYPHGRDDRTFVRCLLTEIQATVLAMRAVRRVNPQAMLVQTDDLGYTTVSGPQLQEQADFENHRRWLGYDLLCGRVTREHPLWDYLVRSGIGEGELQALVDEPCPPDILGINSYITSERFLDDRLELYPPHLHGGNGRHRYADVETARVHGAHIGGFAARLREACERYERPVAITEVHLGCTREEQLRWLHQAWQSAQKLRGEGLDVRAVTVWAAYGTFDWDSLVTREQGHYEPGLWDIRGGGTPRPTALAHLAADLGHGREPKHPVLAGPGWWQRELRLLYPHHGDLDSLEVIGQPVLITGATGTLGRAYARMCDVRGLPYKLLTRQDMDIADPASVAAALDRWQPWAVINTAGYVRVDDAENDPRNWRENVDGPVVLAAECARRGIRIMSFSSDLVFDGDKNAPYVETDEPRPLCAYGRTKAEAEQRLLAVAADTSLVIRTAAFFGPWDRHNFVTQALAAIRRGERWHAAADQWVSPTYVPDLVRTSLDLLIDGEHGIWHLANRGAVSWEQLARMAAEAAGLDHNMVQGRPGAELGWVACRPRFSALDSEKGVLMPTLEDGLVRYLDEVDTALLE